MSTVEGAEHKQEIIIVRRGGHDDHDGHHGGVWKIAFADFMTAMMCFFLVMWLINAANEQTKASVASYFNPIKLTDRNTSRKGLDDVGEGPTTSEESAASAEGGTEPDSINEGAAQRSESQMQADDPKHTDQHLFANPYSVLAEIAAEIGSMQNVSEKGDGGAQMSGPATGASGGESFRDPFAPDFWSQEVAPTYAGEDDKEEETEPTQDAAKSVNAAGEVRKSPAEIAEAAEAATALEQKPLPVEPPPIEAAPEPASKTPVPTPAKTAKPAAPEPPKPEAANAEVRKEADEIRQALREAFGKNDRVYDGISVEVTPRGISISVTDILDFAMFEVGSAVPRRDLVLAMEKIAKILSERTGKITLNGHTDARPFLSKTYDNWRLSSARAHSAYYMLVRAGLEEKRIQEVAGFADRKLKVLNDPLAAANRRIEILLETGG